jgi:hypothetical protein
MDKSEEKFMSALRDIERVLNRIAEELAVMNEHNIKVEDMYG